MQWEILAGVVICVFGASYWLTRFASTALARHSVLDRPNERSSHFNPTPRGGGLAVMAVVLPAIMIVDAADAAPINHSTVLCGLAVVLAAVSWIDDLKGVTPVVRLAIHAAAVAVALSLSVKGPFFGGFFPPWLDTIAAGLAWIWFINLFNFMDGIDGITGTETVSVGLGIVVLYMVSEASGGSTAVAMILIASAGGFLICNWHPARIFLGDVGSVPLGFVLGWLLLTLAADGYLAAALILPLYYLVDATWTLLRRLARGEKVWQAHREHFYQRAVQAGLGHNEVVRAIAFANAALILLAFASLEYTWVAVIMAFGVVQILVWFLSRHEPAASHEER